MNEKLPPHLIISRRKVKTMIEEDILLRLQSHKISVTETYSDVLRRILNMGK